MVEHHRLKLVVVLITSKSRDSADDFEIEAEEDDSTATARQRFVVGRHLLWTNSFKEHLHLLVR